MVMASKSGPRSTRALNATRWTPTKLCSGTSSWICRRSLRLTKSSLFATGRTGSPILEASASSTRNTEFGGKRPGTSRVTNTNNERASAPSQATGGPSEPSPGAAPADPTCALPLAAGPCSAPTAPTRALGLSADVSGRPPTAVGGASQSL